MLLLGMRAKSVQKLIQQQQLPEEQGTFPSRDISMPNAGDNIIILRKRRDIRQDFGKVIL